MRVSVTRCRIVPSGSSPVLRGRDAPLVALPFDRAARSPSFGSNWWPLIALWRMNTWYGSIAFSWVWNQLHGASTRSAEREVVDDHDLLVVAEILEDVVAREHRLLVGRADVGEDQTVVLDHRVPRLAVRAPVAAAIDFARLVEALPVGGEQPTVVRAADAVVLDLAEEQARAAVAAPRHDADPVLPRAVAEQDQVLAERSAPRAAGSSPPTIGRPDASSGGAAPRRVCRDRPRPGRDPRCPTRSHRRGRHRRTWSRRR